MARCFIAHTNELPLNRANIFGMSRPVFGMRSQLIGGDCEPPSLRTLRHFRYLPRYPNRQQRPDSKMALEENVVGAINLGGSAN
jgi:hypothetical protein